MSPEKTLGPFTTLSFAGIEHDSQLQLARLPKDKLEKCIDMISDFLHRKKVTLNKFQSLIGILMGNLFC